MRVRRRGLRSGTRLVRRCASRRTSGTRHPDRQRPLDAPRGEAATPNPQVQRQNKMAGTPLRVQGAGPRAQAVPVRGELGPSPRARGASRPSRPTARAIRRMREAVACMHASIRSWGPAADAATASRLSWCSRRRAISTRWWPAHAAEAAGQQVSAGPRRNEQRVSHQRISSVSRSRCPTCLSRIVPSLVPS